MKLDTQTFSSDQVMVDVIWNRAKMLHVAEFPAIGHRSWPALSMRTRVQYFENAAEVMGVPLR